MIEGKYGLQKKLDSSGGSIAQYSEFQSLIIEHSFSESWERLAKGINKTCVILERPLKN